MTQENFTIGLAVLANAIAWGLVTIKVLEFLSIP